MNRPDRPTLVAFVFLVLIGGSNAVAVRFAILGRNDPVRSGSADIVGDCPGSPHRDP
jgi:hypothetical protein